MKQQHRMSKEFVVLGFFTPRHIPDVNHLQMVMDENQILFHPTLQLWQMKYKLKSLGFLLAQVNNYLVINQILYVSL